MGVYGDNYGDNYQLVPAVISCGFTPSGFTSSGFTVCTITLIGQTLPFGNAKAQVKSVLGNAKSQQKKIIGSAKG